MTGDLVTRVARTLVHASTFTLVVSPAIADLQFEEHTHSRRARLVNYVAVWVALAGGMWQDLVWDRRRPAWADAVSITMTLVFLMVSYHLSMLTLVLGFDRRSMDFVRRLFASITPDWTLTTCGIIFAVAALFVASKAHSTERHDRVGVVDR